MIPAILCIGVKARVFNFIWHFYGSGLPSCWPNILPYDRISPSVPGRYGIPPEWLQLLAVLQTIHVNFRHYCSVPQRPLSSAINTTLSLLSLTADRRVVQKNMKRTGLAFSYCEVRSRDTIRWHGSTTAYSQGEYIVVLDNTKLNENQPF